MGLYGKTVPEVSSEIFIGFVFNRERSLTFDLLDCGELPV
jgi:hypothetical protein